MPVGNPLFSDYEPLADDNQAAAPIGAPEGSYQGRWVNDTFRHLMATVRKLGDGVLHLDGSTIPTANIDMGGFQLRNVATATNRTAAATTGQVQDTTFQWGGTTTGNGTAYSVVLTPIMTRTSYAPGQQVRAIFHATNTSVAPTFSAGTAGPKVMVHRNGAQLGLGDIRASTRYTLEFDGTSWRVLDAGGWMDQATYDDLYPVGECRFIREPNPTPVVPAGVSATWARHGAGLYLRTTEGAAGAGGSLNTSVASDHAHGVSITSGDPSPTQSVGAGAGASGTAQHKHSVIGNTGNAGAHQHTIEPTYISGQLWQRTA